MRNIFLKIKKEKSFEYACKFVRIREAKKFYSLTHVNPSYNRKHSLFMGGNNCPKKWIQ